MDLASTALCESRASFCELMAIKMLKQFKGFDLVVVCTTPWNSLQGASDDIVRELRAEVGQDEDLEEPLNALEVARTALFLPGMGHEVAYDFAHLGGDHDRVQALPLLTARAGGHQRDLVRVRVSS